MCRCVLPGLLLVAFALCMFILYSLMPIALRLSGATAVNLSILTADLYSLLLGLFIFHYVVRAFLLVLLFKPTPQGKGQAQKARGALWVKKQRKRCEIYNRDGGAADDWPTVK